MDRRSFIQGSLLASSSWMVPSFIKKAALRSVPPSGRQTLIVIQLSGGNDGLNCLIPFQNDLYYKYRPSLGIQKEATIRISDELGLNPALKALAHLYDAGDLSIVNNVGYPNPDRSHFRSMDIWQTGNTNDDVSTGWLGRYLDSECTGCIHSYHAIEIGDELSLTLKGADKDGFAMRGPKKLQQAIENKFLLKLGKEHNPKQAHGTVDYLYKTMIEVQESAHYLTQKASKGRTNLPYPNSNFGQGLKQIAELMIAGTETSIYYISLPGFDTHTYQKARQERLLSMYSDGVSTLVKDLKSHGLFDSTLIMTFSEFGRRVEENGSLGTDHGTANQVWMMSGSLKKAGLYNPISDLTELDQGDLKYQIDFRSVYANVLEDWLDTKATPILGTIPPKTMII